MALEAVVFPQDVFSYNFKDLYSVAVALNYEFKTEEEGEHKGGIVGSGMGVGCMDMSSTPELGSGLDGLHGDSSSSLVQNIKEWDVNSSTPETCTVDGGGLSTAGSFSPAQVAGSGRRKRRRTRTCKNKEEVENQRMTHIAVERNRRKQMNEYLSVLRSLMPASYVQRGDQASIIGGAINFVKELEQLLQSLEAQKRMTHQSDSAGFSPSPFADFFTFPQYTSSSTNSNSANETLAENRSAIADIEVTMVESHANLKIFSKKRPKQLLKMVTGFQNLHLTILHLNVTTIDQMVLYSFSLKVEDDCRLTSVDDIATAVYQMLGRIQAESNSS
ncbi:transcription factor bHLH96-like [Aristolochia californica]|uniref:transcription factor bHLH96-like n=1 Tax=Aristolochia californica TaxID=171875 RepID=UPI0035D6A696